MLIIAVIKKYNLFFDIIIKKENIMTECPCGSKKAFSECCEPIIKKTLQASSPEKLMRSRYSAFAKSENEYLVFSTLKKNQSPNDLQELKNLNNSVKWLKLEIVDAYDDIVEFKAYYLEANEIKVLHEKSNFVKEDGLWKYDSGELFNTKIQRNQECPCGSGKKFKKCCG